ncbi:hypothetical protein GKC30_12040 [Pseudodesulfovibrio sp. F-1]|uniref:Uncharacterized protein n=1 Tax=Pseudodesulfovibrio alkaliphilus TaxID=2661613 RepID=A0A7K1KQJ1_9BACT|nr:hypothetical protein [Pseudodesulfovibrio alkaliphilus]MUM78365.1 hypothetical protein [Pseudodesulfovibrio alkaliphilus]
MADILSLPGDVCRHHMRGRCLYEEHLNPGYCAAWRCMAIARWESAFDDFLVRAERFDLGQEQAASLWERRFSRMIRSFDCERYEPDSGEEMPACVHLCDGLCCQALPPCEGRCRHFRLPQIIPSDLPSDESG